MIQFLSVYEVSLLTAFWYRYALVSNKVDKLHSKKSILIMLVLHIVLLWPIMILFSLGVLNADEASNIYEKVNFVFYYKNRSFLFRDRHSNFFRFLKFSFR